MQISFCLGLRVQEIALLELKEVCSLGPARKTVARSFKLKQILKLTAAYTKGADALNRSTSTYQRETVSFSVEQFDQIVKQIITLANAGADVDPEAFSTNRTPTLTTHTAYIQYDQIDFLGISKSGCPVCVLFSYCLPVVPEPLVKQSTFKQNR